MNSRLMKRYRIYSKHRFAELFNYALQYNEWKLMLEDITSISAINNDGLPKGTGTTDPTGNIAVRSFELKRRIENIEKAALRCSEEPNLQRSVLYAVTHEGVTFNYLKHSNILHFERDAYYIARMKFYWELDKMV